ncbi:hypothetical protein [Glycomyces sp. YM15]|uniref:hypothetical protein n=1 Tax=Glycomyces sp. YM15 TaxID=2800446 RepID=UPI001966933C|nr:hypothetical protein [Glycomyces sp. YM15]
MSEYKVTATHLVDVGLWELEILGVGTTQAEGAAEVELMVRDYLDCFDMADAYTAGIAITWHPDPATVTENKHH